MLHADRVDPAGDLGLQAGRGLGLRRYGGSGAADERQHDGENGEREGPVDSTHDDEAVSFGVARDAARPLLDQAWIAMRRARSDATSASE